MQAFRITIVALSLLLPAAVRAEYFVDVGLAAGRLESRINGGPNVETTDVAPHVGIGVRRAINERSDIGVRLEVDSIDSDLFLAIRALDYRRQATDRLTYGFFAGAARLDFATPAYGWYLGAGLEIRNVVANWSLGIDLRFGDKVARDNLLPDEPDDLSPDNFHDVTGVSVYLSRRF